MKVLTVFAHPGPRSFCHAVLYRWMVVSLIVALNSISVAQAQSRGPVLWTISGAGAGFGIGLWAGLSAFDDTINSDRKVWTSAIVGLGNALAHGDQSRPIRIELACDAEWASVVVHN